ncbi:MAG: hypothetical protein AB8B55_04175 [Mariniblastus sp.]
MLRNLFQFLATMIVVGPLLTAAQSSTAQTPKVVSRINTKGVITEVKPGLLSVKHEDGTTITYKIQDKDETAISIGGIPVRNPAKITVSGSIPGKLAEKGMIVKFSGRTNIRGKADGELDKLIVLPGNDSAELTVDFLQRPEGNEPADVDVVARVINLGGNKLQLQVPKNTWARKERIVFPIAENSVLEITDDSLNRIRPNDIAKRISAIKLSTGDWVINEIDIFLAADRSQLTTSFHEKLEQKFSHLSNEPGEPRERRSDHFVLYTDISERDAGILLSKLETMYGLISNYYGARSPIPIECFVVRDLRKWPDGRIPPRGIAKIAEPAGVTMTLTNSKRQSKAVVYSCDKHSVVQHEAVHAFCAQTFGSPGPVWYSEGMAEMGQYWKPGQLEVAIDPVVIDYLTTAQPKKMAEIVAAGQITGDSWQAYAWRWALCHLLASNPNYRKRFKRLGMNIMAGKTDSFDQAFGKVANEISFEYDQFVKNFGNGYRVDLCAWDWRTRASNLTSAGRLKQKVKSAQGWKGTKLLAKEGVSYDFVAQGEWSIDSTGEKFSADGDAGGAGRLIGVLLSKDLKLGEPFELGKRGSFVAQEEGQLYVRCRENWTSLGDNEGAVELILRRTPKEK